MAFSLEKFEAFSYSQNYEFAMRELVAFLGDLDSNYGEVGSDFLAKPLGFIEQQDVDQHLWTRAAAAASCLLADKNLTISPEWQLRVLTSHRWLSALFAASPFRNADHVMRALNINEDKGDLSKLQLASQDMLKFCWLYTPESEVSLDLDALWEHNNALAAGLCIVLLSPRFLGSVAAHAKREAILPWLTEKLAKIQDIDQLPVGVLHDLSMHCSYADRVDKHDIKKSINYLICKKIKEHGLKNWPQTKLQVNSLFQQKDKPILVVVVEWFTSGHSIYRTHSLTIEGARDIFHVIGIGYSHTVDEITRQVFDEFIALNSGSMVEQLRQIQTECNRRNAQICYMPSVGMFPLTMWLANLKVAPLQIMALGHPATTHADAIDYVVVEEDYVGDPACFSEKLLQLPSDGMPYRPSSAAQGLNIVKNPRDNPDVVEIAMCATTMKLNPRFLSTCARIVKESKIPVHFRLLIGQAQGLTFPNVQRVVHQFLGDNAKVYPHQSYEAYMKVIADCDLFVNPFPFGNTNGIIDTVSAGLVGICKTGAEVHEHIDEGIFKRLGLPEWMITNTENEYIAATLRLVENHEERNQLRKKHAGPEKIQVMFEGRNKIMGVMFKKALIEKINMLA